MVTMGYAPGELCAVEDTSVACSGVGPTTPSASTGGVSYGALAGSIVGTAVGTAALAAVAWYLWGRSPASLGYETKPLLPSLAEA